MEYVNVTLRFDHKEDDLYEVVILDSPAGQTKDCVTLPVNDPEFLEYCRIVRHGGGLALGDDEEDRASRGLAFGDSAEPIPNPREVAAKIGEKLFDSVFTTDLARCFQQCLAEAESQSRQRDDSEETSDHSVGDGDRGKVGVRLRLRLNDPRLARIPWEFLYDRFARQHISLAPNTTVSRYLEVSKPAASISVRGTLNILGIVASPSDLAPLDYESEQQKMQRALSNLIDPDKQRATLQWLESPTVRELTAALSERPFPHIVHFIGHGGFDDHRRQGFIVLCDDEGKSQRFHADALANLLIRPETVQLVVLNCCEGAVGSTSDLFSSVGAGLTEQGVPAVISMQDLITDVAAIEFSRALYDQIASKSPIDAAINAARNAIFANCYDSTEWGTPVLHMRSADGNLFGIHYVSKRQPSELGQSGQSAPRPIKETARAPELDTLLARVIESWTEQDGANHSASGLVPLEMEDLFADDEGREATISTSALVDYFNHNWRSVLLLGDPGTGKTTALTLLVSDLARIAETDPNAPIPVIVPISSWSGQPLIEWLIQQIHELYKIPTDRIVRGFEHNDITVLLDGLDEVSGSHRAACVTAINDISPNFGIAGLCVTCRTAEYVNLDQHIDLRGAVRIKELRDVSVTKCIESWGAEFAGLLEHLENDSAMRLLARSPLMLSLMEEVYRGVSYTAVDGETVSDSVTRRNELMEAYVNRMFARARGEHT